MSAPTRYEQWTGARGTVCIPKRSSKSIAANLNAAPNLAEALGEPASFPMADTKELNVVSLKRPCGLKEGKDRAKTPSPDRPTAIAQKITTTTRAHPSKPLLALPAAIEQGGDVLNLTSAQLAKTVRSPPRRVFGAMPDALSHDKQPRNPEDLQGTVNIPLLNTSGDEIKAADVRCAIAPIHSNSGTWVPLPLELPFRQAREAFERIYFEQFLARENGSRARVAEKSGVERTHLYRKLNALGIKGGKDDRSI